MFGPEFHLISGPMSPSQHTFASTRRDLGHFLQATSHPRLHPAWRVRDRSSCSPATDSRPSTAGPTGRVLTLVSDRLVVLSGTKPHTLLSLEPELLQRLIEPHFRSSETPLRSVLPLLVLRPWQPAGWILLSRRFRASLQRFHRPRSFAQVNIGVTRLSKGSSCVRTRYRMMNPAKVATLPSTDSEHAKTTASVPDSWDLHTASLP